MEKFVIVRMHRDVVRVWNPRINRYQDHSSPERRYVFGLAYKDRLMAEQKADELRKEFPRDRIFVEPVEGS